MSQPRKVTLANIAGGRAEAQFQQALQKVHENTEDPSTDHKAKRTILVKLTFLPSPDRTNATVVADVSTKLAAAAPHSSAVYLGKVRGERVVTSNDMQQEDLLEAVDAEAVPTPTIAFGAGRTATTDNQGAHRC